MVMESTVVKDVSETTVFGEYRDKPNFESACFSYLELVLNIPRSALFRLPYCNKEFPVFLKQTEVHF